MTDENYCERCNKKVRGKFGLAWIAESPGCKYEEPTGWQVEFIDTPSRVFQKCRDMIRWVNEPPIQCSCSIPSSPCCPSSPPYPPAFTFNSYLDPPGCSCYETHDYCNICGRQRNFHACCVYETKPKSCCDSHGENQEELAQDLEQHKKECGCNEPVSQKPCRDQCCCDIPVKDTTGDNATKNSTPKNNTPRNSTTKDTTITDTAITDTTITDDEPADKPHKGRRRRGRNNSPGGEEKSASTKLKPQTKKSLEN